MSIVCCFQKNLWLPVKRNQGIALDQNKHPDRTKHNIINLAD